MSMVVDHDICSWLLKSGDQSAILIVKDIDCMVEDLAEGLNDKRLKTLKHRLIDIMNNMEYAVVTVQRNGTVKWQGGKFVEGGGDVTIEDFARSVA